VIEREFWRCWPWLAAALKRGRDVEVQPEAVLALLHSGHAQLWPAEDGAIVTQLHAETRCVHVWLGGGKLSALLDMRAGIEAWARAQGCALASIDGRRGWDRLFGPHGYERHNGELVKAL
jgi:hypothetical protein